MSEAHLLDQLSEVANILYDYFDSPKKKDLFYLFIYLIFNGFVHLP